MRFTYQNGAQPLAGYTIQRGIHRGGFGEVYFAQSDGGKEVALKLLHRQDQDVEIRGVTQCLNLKHPNLVNLFDLKTDLQGDHWVVMEYVSGSSLEDVLTSFPDGLPIAEVRDWLNGLVAGVAHLHDRGIVHRDLKPANVYRENGVVKVGDVGLSKRLDSDHRRQHTQSVGTVYYMAPEVARGQYGPEVDVYSLGVMLYELITGKLPFTGETTAEILMKHLTAQADLSPIPKSLRPTIARALEKDPRKRTPTVRELERDFLRAVNGSPEPIVIPETAFLPPVPPRRNPDSQVERSQQFRDPIHQPTFNGQPLHSQSNSTKDLADSSDQNKWTKFVIPITIALFLIGGTNRERPALPILVAVGLAIYFTQKSNSGVVSSSPRRSREETRSESTPRYAADPSWEARQTFAEPAFSKPIAAKPERPWSERWPELATSLGSSALIASLLSTAVYLSFNLFPIHSSPVLPSIEHAVLFTATSIIGAWLVLAGFAMTDKKNWTNRQRWFARLTAGLILGTFAFGLDEFLMVSTPPAAFTTDSAFSSLGNHALTGPGVDPNWLGYCCFFAGWLGLRRWTCEMDRDRKKRFRIWTTFVAVIMAFLVSAIFKFPQWYAVLWAGTISTTVQLASSWSPLRPAFERR